MSPESGMDLPTDTYARYLTQQGLGSSLPMAAWDPGAQRKKPLSPPSHCPPSWARRGAQKLVGLDRLSGQAQARCSEKPLLSPAAPITPFVSHSSLGSPPRGTVIHQLLPGLVLSAAPLDAEAGGL